MARRTAYLAIALVVSAAFATVAWASAAGPTPNGYYASSNPRLSVYVDKPATKVQLYIGCFTSENVSESWDSGNLPLRHDRFSFDGTTTISTEDGATFGHLTGTVIFNGTFSHRAFRGTGQIVGSICAKHSYTARFDRNGAGSGR